MSTSEKQRHSGLCMEAAPGAAWPYCSIIGPHSEHIARRNHDGEILARWPVIRKVSVELTREQLEEIEWSARCCEGEEACCAVCGAMRDFRNSDHAADCWIGKALKELA